jgi:beta-N-acetylhexosaminidase
MKQASANWSSEVETTEGPDEASQPDEPTIPMPRISRTSMPDMPTTPLPAQPRASVKRGQALLLMILLGILIFRAINLGAVNFPGDWNHVLNGPSASDSNPLQSANSQLHDPNRLGVMGQSKLTPQQYINLIIQHMTLDEKLGQMLIVQFTGPSYSLDLSTMISQYDVGAVLLSAANDNIVGREQLKGLIQQMQQNSEVPLAIATDQEGGTVDRLASLDGPRPAAATIGASNDTSKAFVEGLQDANDLSSYGINLNLAPVVDVTNVYNSQLYTRTYGNNATIVTKMAEAYLQGLQQSGKVMGTLKHFPGLGDVVGDPHNDVPYLTRSRKDLEAIDWAPYRTLIQQGDVYSIMVTHEMVPAIDSSVPSSLSSKLVTGILRDELGFQGVIMTDSLSMEGIAAYYNEAEAGVLAIEAGDDLLMGPTDAHDVAAMIEGMKQAVNAGEISTARIDESVKRILMLKYQMGLLQIPS